MPPRKKTEAVPIDVERMHRELSELLSENFKQLGESFGNQVGLQVGAIQTQVGAMQTQVESLTAVQEEQAKLIAEVQKQQWGCKARNDLPGINARLGRLEKFRNRLQDTGIFAATSSDKGQGGEAMVIPLGNKGVKAIFWVILGAAAVGAMVIKIYLLSKGG